MWQLTLIVKVASLRLRLYLRLKWVVLYPYVSQKQTLLTSSHLDCIVDCIGNTSAYPRYNSISFDKGDNAMNRGSLIGSLILQCSHQFNVCPFFLIFCWKPLKYQGQPSNTRVYKRYNANRSFRCTRMKITNQKHVSRILV